MCSDKKGTHARILYLHTQTYSHMLDRNYAQNNLITCKQQINLKEKLNCNKNHSRFIQQMLFDVLFL